MTGTWCIAPEKKRGKSRYRYDFFTPFEKYREMLAGGWFGDFSWVTPHTMRHTFGSLLAIAGESLMKISEWMGDDPRVTERHYCCVRLYRVRPWEQTPSYQAFDTFAQMRDTDAQTAEPDMEVFFSSYPPNSASLDAFTQNANNELNVVYGIYPPPLGGGGASSGGVTIIASTPDAYEAGPTSGLFTVSRPTATTNSLTVNYTVGGTAVNGTDYTTLSGSVVIAANQVSAQIIIAPIQHALGANKTVILTVSTGSGYTIDSAYSAATVKIYDYENGVTSNGSLDKRKGLAASDTLSHSGIDRLFMSRFFAGGGRHMSINSSSFAALLMGQVPSLPPQLGTSTFFTDVQSRLTATGSKMYCGTTYLPNTSGLPMESGRSSVPINYFVFSADSYHMTAYPASAVGTIIDNAVAANPGASLVFNGAQCNYHCPSLWKRIITHSSSANAEPFQTIGVVVHGGSVLSTSSNSSKKSWATALARYWFGQSTAANSGQALSYQFGQGNPTANATPEAIGGLTGFIYPSGHALSGAEAKDLRVYSPDRLGGGLPGFNVIGVDRNTGMVIVVTKDHEMQGSLFDVQALLTASGVDLAEVTDGGGSVGCWSRATGYVSKGERQVGILDNHNTVTTYLIFSPNP